VVDETFDYPEYLSVKKSIDDTSLNRKVWDTMAGWLLSSQIDNETIEILEIGAGTATMIERLLDEKLLLNCRYTALEIEPGFRDYAQQRLQNWSNKNNYAFLIKEPDNWIISQGTCRVDIQWHTNDITKRKDCYPTGSFDLIIAHAVIDLLPVPDCMGDIIKLLRADGGYYFSLNFAGKTVFTPREEEDEDIITAYHRDMDKRFPGLDWQPSRTGIELGTWLRDQGHKIIAEGESNWQLSSLDVTDVHIQRFINNILETISKALAGLPGLDTWVTKRKEQLESGKLKFFVANKDYFGSIGT
jgi:SAM-dependent methyltransferase